MSAYPCTWHQSVYMPSYLCTCQHICVHASVSVYMPAYLCTCHYICVCGSISLYMAAYLCMWQHNCVHGSISVYMAAYLLYMAAYLCIWQHVCVTGNIFVYLAISLCIWRVMRRCTNICVDACMYALCERVCCYGVQCFSVCVRSQICCGRPVGVAGEGAAGDWQRGMVLSAKKRCLRQRDKD